MKRGFAAHRARYRRPRHGGRRDGARRRRLIRISCCVPPPIRMPEPREAFARDHNARAYADMRDAGRRSGRAGDLYRHAAPVPRAARHSRRRARQAHHPGKADGADARGVRRHHRGGRAAQGASDRRPHPRVRSGDAADARHHRARRAGQARADQQLQLHQLSLPSAPAGGTRHLEGRRHPVQSGAAPDRHRAVARRRHRPQRPRAGDRARSVAADRSKLRGAAAIRQRRGRVTGLQRLRSFRFRRMALRHQRARRAEDNRAWRRAPRAGEGRGRGTGAHRNLRLRRDAAASCRRISRISASPS